MKQRGFTIFELMLTVAIAAILAGIGIPAMGNYISTANARAASNDFASSVALAKSEAIKSGRYTYVSPLNSSASNEWGGGWVVWVDKNQNTARDSASEDVLINDDIGAVMNQTSGTSTNIQFGSSGVAINFSGIQVEVSKNSSSPDSTRRIVSVSAIGSTSVAKK